MKKRHAQIAMIFGPFLTVLAAAVALGFSSGMVWQLIGSGGGTVQGTGRQLTSAIGQPVAGKAYNAYTLYSGFYLNTAPTGPTGDVILLPIIGNNLCDGFKGPTEIEPNDAPSQANGPLCFGVDVKGSPDDHGSALDNDWFKFQWNGSGQVTVNLTNFLASGQLILYYEGDLDHSIARVFDQGSGHYTINYVGTGKSGNYLIRVFAPPNHPTGRGDYTLMVK